MLLVRRCCSLFAVACCLFCFVVRSVLSVVVVCCLLFVVCCSLFVVCCFCVRRRSALSVVVGFVLHSLLDGVRLSLCVARCALLVFDDCGLRVCVVCCLLCGVS